MNRSNSSIRSANDQRQFRRYVENEIERLIQLIDGIDGDPDIEENGDEHDVGMPESWRHSRFSSEPILEDDEDGADDEDGGDTEPNGDETDSNFSEDGI